MVDARIQLELLSELNRMSLEEQRRVLEFAHGLAPSLPAAAPGSSLAGYFGFLSPNDAQRMEDAIRSGCDRVNPDEWQLPT